MHFDLNGYIHRIITNVEANDITPNSYHIYPHRDGVNSTLHLGFQLAEKTTIEFNFNTKDRYGCILLSVESDLLEGVLAKQLSVHCADFSDVAEPLSCDDVITQEEVYRFVKSQWNKLTKE